MRHDSDRRASLASPFLVVTGVLATVALGSACEGLEDPSPTGTGGTWASLAPLPGPRQETAVVALGGEAFVIGGIVDNFEIVTTVEAYDPLDDAWRSLAPLPRALHHADAAVVDGQLVVAGGLTGLNFAGNQRVSLYDAAADVWREGAPLPVGTERGGGAVAVWDGALYLAGGYSDGSARREFSRYLASDDRWEALPSLPAPRDHVLAFAHDARIFVVGGREGPIETHVADVAIFDIATETWSEGAPMPTSRAGAAGALGPDGRFYVVGGEGYGAETSGVFPHTEAYDPVADTWERLEPMRTPRHGMGATFLDGALIVPGGAQVEGFGATDVNESFRPPGA